MFESIFSCVLGSARVPLFLGFILAAVLTSCDKISRVGKTEGNPKEKPNRVGARALDHRGVVSGVTIEWIELAVGWEGHRTFNPETGVQKEVYNGDKKKPKRIETTFTTPGGDPAGVGEFRTHLAADLRVGDLVELTLAMDRAGNEWTLEIRIYRRPGGKIPPMHNDNLAGSEHAFHLRDQAEQDWEEKGIAIPKKYLDKNGRAPWTNPPYPAVAPVPRVREAKP